VLNEGFVFAVRLDDHMPWMISAPERVKAAGHLVSDGLRDLKEFGAVRADA
jgi:hypothetical protein